MSESPPIVVLAGLTGAGKTLAAQQLHILGYRSVDALPAEAIPSTLAQLQERHTHWALIASLGPDGGLSLAQWLRQRRIPLLFLEAADAILVQRLAAQRRPIPSGSLEGIQAERWRLDPLRQISDQVIDTSDLTPTQLLLALERALQGMPLPLRLVLLSFGFKYGVPLDANLMFDVRFLPNPYFLPRLRPLTGQDPALQQFLFDHPQTESTYVQIRALLQAWIPCYRAERRAQVSVAVGCTGGQHRSVALVERLAAELAGQEGILVQALHRHLRASQQELAEKFGDPFPMGQHGQA